MHIQRDKTTNQLPNNRPFNRRQKLENERYMLSKVGLIAIVCFVIVALVWPVSSPDYLGWHRSLFIVCVIDILAAFALLRLDKSFFECFRKLRGGALGLTILEKSNLLWAATTVIALMGLLIVDLSFFKVAGLNIGAVAGIAVVRILWALVRGR